MTFHSRSVVEFGLFYSRISEMLMSGAPIKEAVELVRAQLGAVAAALQIDDRWGSGETVTILVEQAFEGNPAARLAELVETQHNVNASSSDHADGARYTLWLFRGLDAQAFDAVEASVCEIVASQIRRFCEISARIGNSEMERNLYSTVMDRLAVGVVIVDVAGHIVRCSPKAEEALAERDGLQLQAGKLRATCAKEDREFQTAIRTAVQAAVASVQTTRGIALTRLSGHRNLGVIVQPVPGVVKSGTLTPPTVAIFIRDPEATAEVEGELVRQLFDLTRAEAAVARRLASGLSLEDAASSLDISRNTARAHLRSIFSKSGITRQTELVRLMLNSAAMLGETSRQVA